MTAALPQALDAHFSAFATIGVPQLARLLPMDRTTIARHIADETLPSRIKGKGRKKPRRVFTRSDVEAFLEALEETPPPCLSISPPRAVSGTSISRSKVIAFPAQPNARARVTRVQPRRKKKPAPASSSPAGSPPAEDR
ncbi:DNA-binding protein [Bradyrhizobium elkanii]|nr:helix-turn-helix domain-containing protein [Bradyrhizobium elkanii]RYM21129.1 DNA-binding protein [Bradyrhizobium elkanii]